MGLSEDSVIRRLQDVHSVSQETVETISLWIMHYKDKASIDTIVNGWKRCFLSAGDKQRVALFYIMNDVVQKAKNKHLDYLIPAFQPAVLAAIPVGRTSKEVRSVMERCLNIFESRQVFTKASVATMKNLLINGEAGDADEGLELDNEELCNKIEAFDKSREVTERMMTHFNNGVNSYNEQLRTNLRDRQHAYDQLKETETVLDSIIQMRHSMELQKKKQLELVESLVLAQRFHARSLREVTVVEDAYQKFHQSVRDVQKELMEIEKTGIYPAATPPRDAPSPTANDDIYATGVETVLNNLRVPGSRDNHEAADMEVDEDEPMPPSTIPLVIPTQPFPAPQQPGNVGAPGAWVPPAVPMMSPNIPPPMFAPPPAATHPEHVFHGIPNAQPRAIVTDPRQFQSAAPPRAFAGPPGSSATAPPVGQFARQDQGLRDPRQVQQRNFEPPRKAPYLNQNTHQTNPNLIPLGVPKMGEAGFHAPYKQAAENGEQGASGAANPPPAQGSFTQGPSSIQPGHQHSNSFDDRSGHGSHAKGGSNWRGDDHYTHQNTGHGHYDDNRSRRDSGERRNWNRGGDRRDSWDNRRDRGRGGFRERDSHHREDRNGFSGGRGYRGQGGHSGDSGSHM